MEEDKTLNRKSISDSGNELMEPSIQSSRKSTIRNLWKERHARSIEEGIRRERIRYTQGLSNLLDEYLTSNSILKISKRSGQIADMQ